MRGLRGDPGRGGLEGVKSVVLSMFTKACPGAGTYTDRDDEEFMDP